MSLRRKSIYESERSVVYHKVKLKNMTFIMTDTVFRIIVWVVKKRDRKKKDGKVSGEWKKYKKEEEEEMERAPVACSTFLNFFSLMGERKGFFLSSFFLLQLLFCIRRGLPFPVIQPGFLPQSKLTFRLSLSLSLVCGLSSFCTMQKGKKEFPL